jgi:hypothetical protein
MLYVRDLLPKSHLDVLETLRMLYQPLYRKCYRNKTYEKKGFTNHMLQEFKVKLELALEMSALGVIKYCVFVFMIPRYESLKENLAIDETH